MALAELTHHTALRGQRIAGAGGEVRVEAQGEVLEEPPLRAGALQLARRSRSRRPPSLGEPPRPQERI